MLTFGLRRKKAQPAIDRQRQVDLGYATKQIAEGDLSFIAGSHFDGSVVLTFENISLVKPRLSHSSGGIKKKIARGLSYYVAQPQSPEPDEELIELDRGNITITIGGIVFDGKSLHIGVRYGTIESISHSVNGMTIETRNAAQKIRFEGADRVFVTLNVQNRKYNQPLSGKLMRLLVEGVIRISFDGGSHA